MCAVKENNCSQFSPVSSYGHKRSAVGRPTIPHPPIIRVECRWVTCVITHTYTCLLHASVRQHGGVVLCACAQVRGGIRQKNPKIRKKGFGPGLRTPQESSERAVRRWISFSRICSRVSKTRTLRATADTFRRDPSSIIIPTLRNASQ